MSRSTLTFWPMKPSSQQHWRGYSDAAIHGWLDESVSGCVHASVCRASSCGRDTDYSFWPITFKFHMYFAYDERRNPIDFGSRGQRSRSTLTLCLWNLVGKIQTTVFALSLSNYTCQLLMMRGGTLLKVKVNFGTLCIRPWGHDADFSLSPITFKLHM